MEINKKNFDEEVLQAERPVIVDVWGPNCQQCLKLMPDVEALSERYGDKVKIVTLNSVGNRRWCINHRVMGLPAFLVFKNGEEVTRITGGDLTKEDVENLVMEQIES